VIVGYADGEGTCKCDESPGKAFWHDHHTIDFPLWAVTDGITTLTVDVP
jgi:hypothetical protein